jgi:hypothetical protein
MFLALQGYPRVMSSLIYLTLIRQDCVFKIFRYTCLLSNGLRRYTGEEGQRQQAYLTDRTKTIVGIRRHHTKSHTSILTLGYDMEHRRVRPKFTYTIGSVYARFN